MGKGVGTLTAKLLLDDKEATNSLLRFEQHAGDLEKSLGRSTGLEEYSNKVGKTKKGMDDSIPTIQHFRQEQRLQNFVVREGTQSLTSMIFALGFLTQGNEEAAASTKSVQTSLLTAAAAMNAAEFALFGLSRAGVAGISAIAGPVSILIGLTSGLVSFFQQSDAEAEKAAKGGLSEYEKRISGIADKMDKRTAEVDRADEERLRKEMERTRARAELLEMYAENRSEVFDILPAQMERAGLTEVMLDGFMGKQTDALDRAKKLREEVAILNAELLSIGSTATAPRPDSPEDVEAGAERVRKAISDRFRAEKDADRKQEEDFQQFVQSGAEKLNALRVRAIDDEIARINEKYRQEEEQIRLMFVDEAELNEALKHLELARIREVGEAEKKTNKEITDQLQKNLESSLRGAQDLAAGIGRALGEGGENFVRVLQAALQIMAQVNALSRLKSGEDSTGSILSIIGSVIGLVGFDKGGRVGGYRGQPRLALVHGGEMILPTHKYPVPEALHRVMSFDRGGIVPHISNMASASGGGIGGPVVVNVILRGMMSGQRFLRDEMPAFEQFNQSKKVGSG